MAQVNKASMIAAEQNVASGLKEHLPSASIPINGTLMKSKDVQAQIAKHIETVKKVADARAAYAQIVASERVQRAALAPIISGIRSHVSSLFGEHSAEFASFGFKPRKVGRKSAQTKALAVTKLRATRKAREAALHVDASDEPTPANGATNNGSSNGAAS